MCEQPDGGIAVPEGERIGLVLRFLVREVQLQHGVVPSRQYERDVAAREWGAKLQPPLLGAFFSQMR